MDTAVYVRVSTDEQDHSNQVHALQQMATARGLTIVDTFEETMSGAKKKRPKLDALMDGARRGKYRVILVWAIDRLGRSMPAIVDTITELDRLGVAVVSQQEPWLDMTGPVRSLLLSIFAWVAEQERARLIERTKLGMATARRNGKKIGRKRVEFDVDYALRLRKDNLSYAAIAKKMKVGVGTVHRGLQSEDVPASARRRV